jgi:hypothetical protein
MRADLEARSSAFVGALKGLSILIDNQTPGLGASSQDIGDLVRMLAEEAERIVPNQGGNLRLAANDEDRDDDE